MVTDGFDVSLLERTIANGAGANNYDDGDVIPHQVRNDAGPLAAHARYARPAAYLKADIVERLLLAGSGRRIRADFDLIRNLGALLRQLIAHAIVPAAHASVITDESRQLVS